MGASERSRSRVIRVDEDEDLPLLADFVREVWTPNLSLESLRASRATAAASNPADRGQAPPTFLFLLDGRAVGHLTTIPARLRCDDWVGPAHWLKGFWVLPEHRNGPIGAMLVREAARQLDCILATVVDVAPRRVFDAFKIQDLGLLSEHIRLLRPERVLQRLDPDALGFGAQPAMRVALGLAQLPGLSHLGGALLRAAFALRRSVASGARDLRVMLDPRRDAGMEGLWDQVASDVRCSPVRDARYFHRLSAGTSGGSYRILSLERNGDSVAWASIRLPGKGEGDPRLRGIRIATLSEVVVPVSRVDDGLALLREAESVAREEGADALLCTASDPRLRGWLSARAFVRVGGSLHFAARGPKDGPPLPTSLDDWWLTRADGGADEGL